MIGFMAVLLDAANRTSWRRHEMRRMMQIGAVRWSG